MEQALTGSTDQEIGLPENDRRDFLKKAAVGGAAAWAAPMLISSAASAQGTAPCNPVLVDNNNARSTNTASGANIGVIADDPTTNCQIGVALVPLNDATAGTEVTIAGSGWTTLVNKTLSQPGAGNRLAMWVWGRTTGIDSPVSFQLVGDAAGPWRCVAAAFSEVTALGTANSAGAQSATSIPVPSVDIPLGSAGLVMWVGATLLNGGAATYGVPTGRFQGTSDFLNAPNTNTGYLPDVTGPTTVPAESVPIGWTTDVVGAQIPLLCSF